MNRIKTLCVSLVVGSCLFAAGNANAKERLSLAGQWAFSLSAPEPVIPQAALPEVKYSDTIQLPGTTETNHKGAENTKRERDRLARVRLFNGPAWYQRRFEIPAAWQDKRITLFLERTKYTQVWLDRQMVGSQVLYCVPQLYDLGSLTPGPHTLTVMAGSRQLLASLLAYMRSDVFWPKEKLDAESLGRFLAVGPDR